MPPSNISFSLAEKLAIVQALDAVIYADSWVHNGELNAMSVFMNRLGFETNFIIQARNLTSDQGISILENIPEEKKIALTKILNEMAEADNFIHEKEIILIQNTCQAIGIYKEEE